MTEESAPITTPPAQPPPPEWSLATRLAFRFFFVYFVLYILPFPLSGIPLQLVSERAAAAVGEHVLQPYQQGMDKAVKWAGAKFFDKTITIGPQGSGDTTWNYVQLAGFGAIAAAATLVWTLLEWLLAGARRPDYSRLHDWLRAYVRFNLSFTMFGYGFAKVIKTQFRTPTLDALMQPLGEGSPMGLLWNFMGFSDAYCIFTGVAEVLGGALLATRRTATLGSLVTVGVMTNVVMLNFCFDTPVKLYSLNLLAMAVFLVIPDARTLIDVFVLHRPPRFAPLRPLFHWRWAHWSAVGFRTLVIGGVIATLVKANWQMRHSQGELAAKPPLYGTWDVDVFESDDEIVPEDQPGAVDRWQRLRIGFYRLGIEHRGGLMQIMFARATKKGARFDLASNDPAHPFAATCELTTPDALTLETTVDGHKLHVELTRNPSDDYLLTSRGFHWINEFPYNR